MKNVSTLLLLAVASIGCADQVEYIHDRHACPTAGSDADTGTSTGSDAGTNNGSDSNASTSSDTDSDTGTGPAPGSDSDTGSSSDTGSGSDTSTTGDDPEGGLPTPTAPCPTIADGVVQFCPAGLADCRDALVSNAAGATGSGPLALHWHGTYESPDGLMSWDFAAQEIEDMVMEEGGLMVLPYADPGAPTRANTPFPWWVVCGDFGTECDRPDDFLLADEIVACALEQGLVDPDRLTTSGMSAGGVMTSHLIDRTSYFAAAVSWSGGLPVADQPAMPDNDTAVMVMHGGAGDVYCGAGVTQCYDFVGPSEALAQDVEAAGNFAFLCDHQAEHSASMGPQGAQFLGDADLAGHPWVSYPFGSGGNWMLDNYCYLPGQPSPQP